MIRNTIWLLAALSCAGGARAEVKSSSPMGFALENKRVVQVTPAEAFAGIGRISAWWSKSHTYSGDARNLTLSLKAGDCFCERLPDGGTVEHMRVVQARPGQMLRLQGGLGPLQGEAATGTLTFNLKPVPTGTEIAQSYVVGGYIPSGPEKLAPLVDKVLAEQLDKLVAFLGDKSGKRRD